jgi:hypothetical protein
MMLARRTGLTTLRRGPSSSRKMGFSIMALSLTRDAEHRG